MGMRSAETERRWGALSFYDRFEHVVVLILTGLIAIVIVAAVWNLALDPTGGRIRFRTDSSMVAVKLEWPRPPGMRNMHAFGQSGVDLYVGDAYWSIARGWPLK